MRYLFIAGLLAAIAVSTLATAADAKAAHGRHSPANSHRSYLRSLGPESLYYGRRGHISRPRPPRYVELAGDPFIGCRLTSAIALGATICATPARYGQTRFTLRSWPMRRATSTTLSRLTKAGATASLTRSKASARPSSGAFTGRNKLQLGSAAPACPSAPAVQIEPYDIRPSARRFARGRKPCRTQMFAEDLFRLSWLPQGACRQRADCVAAARGGLRDYQIASGRSGGHRQHLRLYR